MGDFNARTGLEPDFIFNDTCKYIDVHTDYTVDTALSRNNLDTKIPDKHGKLLLNLCKSSGLRILNGRKLGDLQGNFTCFNHRGNPSVIDYMLCDVDIFNEVEYFQVQDLVPFSIHCMISCVLKARWCTSKNTCSEDDIRLNNVPIQYFWSPTNANLWRRAMNCDDTISHIESFINQSTQPEVSVDNCTDNFYNLLDSIGKKAGLQKKKTHKKKKCHASNNKKWYDNDCKTFYRKLRSLSRSIKNQPLNIELVAYI